MLGRPATGRGQRAGRAGTAAPTPFLTASVDRTDVRRVRRIADRNRRSEHLWTDDYCPQACVPGRGERSRESVGLDACTPIRTPPAPCSTATAPPTPQHRESV